MVTLSIKKLYNAGYLSRPSATIDELLDAAARCAVETEPSILTADDLYNALYDECGMAEAGELYRMDLDAYFV